MSKINRLSITNFKAIDSAEADFNGCSCIVTAGNNMGKTSFLRGIVDRIRFIRPDIMVKEGTERGKGEMTLDTGEKFVWEFDVEGKDKLIYITSDGVKKSVTKEISKQFFPPTFDIDKFLQSSPSDQSKQLQKIVGIDFTDIDQEYKEAYDDRTEKNRDAEKFHAKLVEMLEVPKVEPVDLTDLLTKKEGERKRLNALYLENKNKNDIARDAWNKEKERILNEVTEFNSKNTDARNSYSACYDAGHILINHGIDKEIIQTFLSEKKELIKQDKSPTDLYPEEPEYIDELPSDETLREIDDEIIRANITNQQAADYKNYVEYKQSVAAAQDIARIADEIVKEIEARRQEMIKTAKFPKGVAITLNGITVDGLPLDRTQISTSKLYTTALRIACMNLGEVKTIYFDASFLDRQSLNEVYEFAKEKDLQLLIERPALDGGKIQYELIEN